MRAGDSAISALSFLLPGDQRAVLLGSVPPADEENRYTRSRSIVGELFVHDALLRLLVGVVGAKAAAAARVIAERLRDVHHQFLQVIGSSSDIIVSFLVCSCALREKQKREDLSR